MEQAFKHVDQVIEGEGSTWREEPGLMAGSRRLLRGQVKLGRHP